MAEEGGGNGQQIEEGHVVKSASVHDVTALIKQFFRELPEPLLTSVFHDCFVRCYHLSPPDQVEAMLLLCLLLPPEHLSTLRYTMGLLSRLAAHSSHNKMDVGNLAVVLAPNIMHVNSRSQKMNSTEEKLLQLQTAIVELLIHNADRLGVVSESLSQRTTLMTECFGTEDELDASDDNTLEDTKEVKKKRRKRSSSLQGLVSSIGRSIAKLRRSTDGKNNLTSSSQMSLSNESGMASQSQSQSLSKTQETSLPPSAPSATPVVMRKRKASGEGVPFSATKK
nr:hypothetical protein BaRGS_018727 [Batillaria attramentaria]